MEPTEVYVLTALGFLHHMDNHFHEAEKYLKMAYRLQSEDIFIAHRFACTLDDLGDYKGAKRIYEANIEKDPSYSPSIFNIGRIYNYNLDNYEIAENFYYRALKFDKFFAHPWNGLAIIQEEEYKNYEKAKIYFEKAIEVDPIFSYGWSNLGDLYSRHFQDKFKAENYYLKAIEVDPYRIYPMRQLSNLYYRYFVNYPKAIEYFEKIEKLQGYPPYDLSRLREYISHIPRLCTKIVQDQQLEPEDRRFPNYGPYITFLEEFCKKCNTITATEMKEHLEQIKPMVKISNEYEIWL